MGYYLAFPILIAAVLLQGSLLPLAFGVAQPELTLMIIISWAVYAEWEEAVFWAFLGGITQDLMSVTPTGTSVIAPLIILSVMKWLEDNLYQYATAPHRNTSSGCLQSIIDGIRNSISAIVILIGFTTIATFLNHIVIVIVMNFTGYNINLIDMIPTFTLPTLAYNLIGITPVYFILRRIQKRLPKPQSAWGVSP